MAKKQTSTKKQVSTKKQKLWCVILTDNDDPHEPTIEHVRADDEDSAYELALSQCGLSLDEANEMLETGIFGYKVIQVKI